MALCPNDFMNTSLQDLAFLVFPYNDLRLRHKMDTNGPKAGATALVARIGDGGNHG